jgi:hypothetical protein
MEELENNSEENLRLFKVFKTSEEAEKVGKVLESNDIPFHLTDSEPPMLLTTGTSEYCWWLLVREDDFDQATDLADAMLAENSDNSKDEYYLFEFSNEELIQVLEKYDEWSQTDYDLAIKILAERGINYTVVDLEKMKVQRIQFLGQPEKGSSGWLAFGFILALCGGIFGIFVGWHHKTFNKKLPNNDIVPCYDPKTQKTGNQIFILSIIMSIVYLVGLILYLILANIKD